MFAAVSVFVLAIGLIGSSASTYNEMTKDNGEELVAQTVQTETMLATNDLLDR